MTIRRLRLIAFLGSLLLVAASVAVTFAALQTQRDDALVINLAGRQRMLIQRMTLEVLGTQIGANRVYREDLHATAHAYFEVTLNALISGGPAPYADGVTVTLPPTRSPQILAQLEAVHANWEEMHTAIHAVLDSDPQGPAFAEGVAAVERLSPVMLAQMDETVRLYEAEAARKVARVQSTQIGFLAAAASLLAAALVLTERWVLNPIDQLGSAARRISKGDLDTPVSVAGLGEIDQLTRSFDDMRRNLAASREERERWAAELDGRVAARTREVISLSTIAQAANRHTEIDSLLDEVLPLLAEITAASSAWVSLLDEYGNFSLAGAHNLPPALEADDRAEMRWPGCLCQRRLLAGELTAAANILECQRLQQARGDTRGLHYHASVPLRAAARALGLLNLTTAAGYVFGDDELRLLTAVGDQLGVAIERARLHAQMKARYVAEQTVLLRLSQALLSESDPQAIMDTAVRVAAEALRVEFAAILLIDADEQSYSLLSSIGWPSEVPQQAQHIPLSADTAVAHTIRTRAPAVIPDHAQETRFGTLPHLAHLGITSSLFVPMLAVGASIGGLGVNSHPRRDWSDDEVRLLSLIANDTAQALERAWQHTRAVERLGRISALHDIDVAITSPLGLQATLDVLLEKVTERLHVDAAAVALIQPETRELVYAAKRGLDGELFADGRLKVKEGIAGQVAHTGEVVTIPDVRAEPRFVRAAIAERLGLVSYLAVPLQARGEILGVLELATRQRHDFPPEEVDFFVTLAGQATIVIDNTRMYEEAVRRAAQQRALAESAGAILAHLDAEATWPTVTEAARQILAADRAALYLYHADADRLTCPYASGLSAEYVVEINRRFREVPGGRLLADPRPVVIADAQTDLAAASVRDLAAREGFRSYAVFPLTAPDLPLGAFVAYRDLVAPFTPDDVTAGQTLAHIASVALQNARLFEALAAEKQHLELLYNLSQSLAVSLDPREVAVRALALTTSALGVFRGEIFVREPGSERLRLVAMSGYDAKSVEALDRELNLRVGQGLAGSAALTRAPHIAPDVAHDEHWVSVPGVDDWVRSAAAIPLLAGDELVGVLNLLSDREGFFHDRDLPLLTAVTVPMALALHNARLFEETGRRVQELALLYDAGLTLNRVIEPRVQLEFLLKLAATALRADAAEFFLFDPARDELRYEFGIGLSAEAAEGLRHLRFAAADENTVPGWVATNRLLLNLPDAPADPRWVVADPAIHSALFVPVAYEKQLRGILDVTSKRGGAFTPQDERLLTLFANQVSVAMNNARLFEETRRRAEELEALSQVSATLRKAQTREAMLPLLVESTMRLLNADSGTLLLVEGETLTFAAARGPAEALLGWRHPLGDDPLWQVARTGEPLFIPEVSEQSEFNRWEISRRLMAGMTACACVPLKTAEATVGLLHLAFRSKRAPTEGETRLLTSIAEMAGNALHRATLHEQTERDAVELALAYDTTLAGWARALELRDEDTEGHTRRVTEMTLQLARAVGLKESELLHIRRGALLHDMGKMGVPDHILLKPGPLTDEEWIIMRQHPQSAYDMLAPIAYLRPALDIPYCHHEKWDGAGYPRGLKGEQIPFAARIFAVVDVWDALRSDRPYREAWPEEKVREYIREQAGKHFDPRVVEVFQELDTSHA